MQRVVAMAQSWRPPVASWLGAWLEAERGRFVPWLAPGMMAGVLGYFALHREPAWWLGAAGLALFAALAVLRRADLAGRGIGWLGMAVCLGFAAAQVATARAPELLRLPARATIVSGQIAEVEQLPGGRRVTLDAAQLDGGPVVPRRLRVRLRDTDSARLQPGDRLRVRALLRPPAPPTMPGAWDLQRDSFYAGLGGSGFALGPAEILAAAPSPGLVGWWRHVRETVQARILADVPDSRGAIAATLLTGLPRAIPDADRAAFRDSGLAHLLAVAGLHIGAVMLAVMSATRFGLALVPWCALRWPCKQIAAGAALAAGGFYLVLTGAHVPILRSFAMAALITLGIMLGRQALSLRGLALAAVVIMLAAPQEVPGVSFQMSFSAVLALISGFEALRPAFARLHGTARWRRAAAYVAGLAATSVLAGTASLPFGAYHFGQIQLYYVVSNMLAVPITGLLIMPAGLLALLLMPLGLEHLALVPMGWGVSGILEIARMTASLPAATLRAPPIPDWGLAALAFGLAWLGLWRSRLRRYGLVPLALGCLSPALHAGPDVLVSADARLIAFRTGGVVYVQNTQRQDDFVLDAWHAVWPGAEWRPMPQLAALPALSCGTVDCLLRGAGPAALLWRAGPAPRCAQAGLLLSANPAMGICPGLRLIDRFTVWREGAQAIWLRTDGPRVVSDRDWRGVRPWIPAPVPAAARPPQLPLAESE